MTNSTFDETGTQAPVVTTSSVAEEAPKRTLRDLDPALAKYRGASTGRSIWQLASTTILFVGSWTAAYLSLSVSYWLTLPLCLLTALLAVRMFIFQHDCGHRSFFKSKKANDTVGFLLGLVTMTPYHGWRREHAIHHANSGDLDRRGRGQGEIRVMTVNEYRNASRMKRLLYRIYRSPPILFCLGPFYEFVIRQRFTFFLPKAWKRERRSVYWLNLMLAGAVALMCWLVGPLSFLMVHLPIILLSTQIGVWLFYVQHQYEEAFYEHAEQWDYVEAAMAGSSHYQLPKVLQWFTGNIGLHHIHHLDCRIPNYRLQRCHDEQPEMRAVKTLTIRESFKCIFVKLWDEDQKKMVGFKAARKLAT